MGQLSAPWHPKWQWDDGALDHEIVRGEAGRVWIVETHGNDGNDPVPRWLHFLTPNQTYRTHLAGLVGDPATLPGDWFCGQAVDLEIQVTNRRLNRARRYLLSFRINQAMMLDYDFFRLRRWPRSARRMFSSGG